LRAGTAAVKGEREATNEVVVFVENLDSATALAAWYARQVAQGGYHAVYVRDPKKPDPRGNWWEIGRVPIETLERREGTAEAVLDYVWSMPHGGSRFVTVVVPESFERPSLLDAVLRRRTTFSLKLRLLAEPGIVLTDVPVLAESDRAVPLHERRLVTRVLVSGVQAASVRAVQYAASLNLPDTRALSFAFDDEEASKVAADWRRESLELPLDVVEAPYRDLGDPLLAYIRELTADPDTIVSVVMPELVFSGWRALLHNQRALYIKRLLLFEPQVVLSSVPYHLR
jgi:hypothetical protein